ncbi:Uncharacterized protein Rs2_23776 [Raphanus sativus]|nr:Uncharacterized protein Rs2_23776 [Raphanus sativus]
MVLMVTSLQSRFRPPPDPPPSSPCKPLRLKLALPTSLRNLQTHQTFSSSLLYRSSILPSVLWFLLLQLLFEVSLQQPSSPTFQIEPWFLFAGTSLLFVKFSEGIDTFENGGFGWCIHGMDGACDSQNSFSYMISSIAVGTLALQEALLSASCAGFSKLQVTSDSNVFLFVLRSGMDLIGIAGCLHDITNLATLFTPLSFKFYQCTTVCMAVAFAMYVFFKLCFSITLL